MPEVDIGDEWPAPVGGARRGRSRIPPIVLAVVCLAALAVAGVELTGELTRGPHPAELRQAGVLDVARRWQTWPAGKIFPETVGYTLEEGGPETARLVGIGTAATCATGLGAAAAAAVRPFGCQAVLRATYLDQSQGSAMTVGVAVFADERSAALAKSGLRPVKGPARLRALAFPRSAVARFVDAAVQRSAPGTQQGPYVAFAEIGYADGRPAPRDRQGGLLPDVADQLARAVLTPLATPARVDCAQPGFSC